MDIFASWKQKGFSFNGVRDLIRRNDPAKMAALAQDAALITTPNAAIPAEFTAYIDPMVVEILTAARNARQIFTEVKKGDWTTAYEKFRVEEFTGNTTPYNDYDNGAVSNVNENWPTREQYRFQTNIKYGVLESDIASIAKLNLASAKQKAAARTIDIDANKFYLYGVAQKSIYGLLNDPNLNAAITPTTGVGGNTWLLKTTKEIYNDIMTLWANLKQNSGGNIDLDSDVCLVVSPTSSTYLDKATDYNISVRTMLDRAFNNKLSIIEIPELYSSTAGNTVMLIARDILGLPTAQLGFGEKYRAFPVIQRASSYDQKVMATTYGCIIYRPFGIAQMQGV